MYFRNPTKGVIINHPNGPNVYPGVPHDYTDKVGSWFEIWKIFVDFYWI